MKTGGMSLSSGVAKNFAVDEVYPHPELDLGDFSEGSVRFRAITIDYLLGLPAERRDRIRYYAGHFPYVTCELLGGDFATLTILRDPVDRTVSLLRQFQRYAESKRNGDPQSTEPTSFEAIYEQPHVYEPLVLNHQTKIFSMTREDSPRGYMQTMAIDDERLALAKRNLEAVDVVGLTERHGEFIDHLAHRFGWQLKRDRRVNAAPSDSPALSRSLRRRIEADNAIDMEFYAFAKELVDAREA